MKLTTTKTKQQSINSIQQLLTPAFYGYEEKNLWLLSGGSNVDEEAACGKNLSGKIGSNTVVALVDEHYHEYNHPDSNARKLKDAGFPFVEFLDRQEILLEQNPNLEQTAELYSQHLQQHLQGSNLIINLGFGVDMHVAGLMATIAPHSIAYQDDFVIAYQVDNLRRISITEKVITSADSIILYGSGEQKQKTIELAAKNSELALHRILNLPQTHLIICEEE